MSNLDSHHLGFFAKGLQRPVILGQNFSFFLSVCMVKMDMEMEFGDVLDCS